MRPLFVALCVVASLACAPPRARAQEGKRFAVLVGVNSYEHQQLPGLKYAVNDATALGELLGKAGYSVSVLTDDAGKKNPKLAPTKTNIEAQLKEVLKGAQKGDLVLVGFAGHGLQFVGDQDAYFCPSDAKPFKNNRNTLVSLKQVYGDLQGSFAGMKVLLVDACRDDPAVGRGVSADGAPPPPAGIAAIFSCKAGQRAFEHDERRHGVFFYHVLTGLRGEAADKKGRITFAGLAAHVGLEVPPDVSVLVGGGAVQTPNLRAEYTVEPILLTPRGIGPPPVRVGNEALATDLRAIDRDREAGLLAGFIKETAPKRLKAWRKAAEAGDPAGQVLLSACYAVGAEVKKDDDLAFQWLVKAAESGSPQGAVMLGLMYEHGRGVPKSDPEAIKWYKRAAAVGYGPGMNNLGTMYMQGRGVKKNEQEAVRLHRAAADAGSGIGMSNLGVVYWQGLGGVDKNMAEAIRWFTKAADAGAPQGMHNLGVAYANGAGVEKNATEAVKCYRKAAELGHGPSMFALGLAYLDGTGVDKKNPAEGAEWITKGAEAGDLQSMHYLARLYTEGLGVEINAQEAFQWIVKAADAGYVPSMIHLGRSYEAARSRDEAIKWFRKAAEAGNADAKARLERLLSQK